MKRRPITGLSLFFIMTTTVFAGNLAAASSDTWGKTDITGMGWQSVGSLKMATAWRSDDSQAHIIEVPAEHSWTHAAKSDTKGIVISGELELDDTLLTSGAYWSQPGGSSELLNCISANGCTVYLESESTMGKLSRTVIAATDIPWFEVPNTYGNVFLAWVWGEAASPEPSGFFRKFKAGFPGAPHSHTESYNGVVVQGEYKHWEVNDDNIPVLQAGTSFWQSGDAAHDDGCKAGQDCISYFRIDGQFDYFPYKQ